MILLQIPENTNELRDHKVFINAVQEFNKFQKNVTKYLKKIVHDEYLKPVHKWNKIANEKDLDYLQSVRTKECFYCYKTNRFIDNYYGAQSIPQFGWMMGAEGEKETTYILADDGVTFKIINTWSYTEVRGVSAKWYKKEQIYEINLLEKSVKCIKNSKDSYL